MYEIFNFPKKEEGSEYLRRKWGQKILWASAGRGNVILQIWKEIIRKSSILLQWKNNWIIDDNSYFGTLKYSVILLLASARPLLFRKPGKEMLGKIGFQL